MSVKMNKRSAIVREKVKPTKPLRVWWIPQVPGTPFRVPVNSLEEAQLLLQVLADYDKFQLEHNIKPDYCNAGGLEVFEDGEWSDWYDDEGAGGDIDEWSEQHPRKTNERPAHDL